SLGDGMGDQRLALFAQQFDKAGFLYNQRVDASGFAIEVGRYCLLLSKRRRSDLDRSQIPLSDMHHTDDAMRLVFHMRSNGLQTPVEPRLVELEITTPRNVLI